MIYIITPYLSDLRQVCIDNGIMYQIKNGKLLNKNIIWIHDLICLQLFTIKKHDKIYFGEQCDKFPKDQLDTLINEIEKRKVK